MQDDIQCTRSVFNVLKHKKRRWYCCYIGDYSIHHTDKCNSTECYYNELLLD